MKLLDTTFLIHYWGGAEATAEYLDAHDGHEFVTTAINLEELAVGRAIRGDLDRNEIASTFDWVTVLPFTADHAYVAGTLEAELRRSDVDPERLNALAGDVLIGAVAEAEGATVVTRNVEDFELLDVSVEPY